MFAHRAGDAEDSLIPPEWLAREVAVIGLGRTGIAASVWLAARGVRVYASDAAERPELSDAAATLRRKSVAVELGRHDLRRIGACAAVVVSPGVPPGAAPVVAARDGGVTIVAELDLAARALAGVKLAVVTGTNGKTTTTACAAHLLRAAGVRSEAAGNIGRPLIELADRAGSLDWVVVEASSFQLHDAPNLTPALGVVTNLAPDHLDRYATVEAYYADKRLLFRNADDASLWILNGDDAAVGELAAGVPGARRTWSIRGTADAWWDRRSGALMLGDRPVVQRTDVPLLGDHNVENVLAAFLAAAAAGADPEALAAGITSFQPLPHRLEPVRDVRGTRWVNDSKATNVASTRVALQAMDRPFVLIAGGQDKGEALASLAPLLDRCRRLVAYGQAADKIRRELGNVVELEVTDTLEAAVGAAQKAVGRGETVLLSPACASFDQFRNYEHRGDTFKALVGAL